jgi:predicted 3-demethylubiquinone-9 3-methyltransferase (glyoxalase superfamily)
MQKVTPFLWYEKDAIGVARYYRDIFGVENVKIPHEENYLNDPWGKPVQIVTLELFGTQFRLMSAGKHDEFNDAISFEILCDNQEEIDRYWNALTADGGEESQCGWCRDKYGVRWQISPRDFERLVATEAAMNKMYTMKKLVIAELEALL